MSNDEKHKIFTIIASGLAAGMLGSCTFPAFSQLAVQTQQKASYIYYRMTKPKIAALRIVNKEGDVLLEPEMTRPKVKAFASILADYASFNHSHEFAGSLKWSRSEDSQHLYMETLDADGNLIERFTINEADYVESDSVLLIYPLHGIIRLCPLEYALTTDEIALLHKHLPTKSPRK